MSCSQGDEHGPGFVKLDVNEPWLVRALGITRTQARELNNGTVLQSIKDPIA
jgi:hypothetical protein